MRETLKVDLKRPKLKRNGCPYMLGLRSCGIFPDLSGTYSVYLPKVFTPKFPRRSFRALGLGLAALLFELFHSKRSGLQGPLTGPRISPMLKLGVPSAYLLVT